MSTDNDLVARLRIRWDAMGDMVNNERAAAADEIERLRAERDEARREVCNMNETGLRMNESDKKREAKRRGWDCFDLENGNA